MFPSIAYKMKLELIATNDWHDQCSSADSTSEFGEVDNVFIDEIGIPLNYDDVDFRLVMARSPVPDRRPTNQ